MKIELKEESEFDQKHNNANEIRLKIECDTNNDVLLRANESFTLLTLSLSKEQLLSLKNEIDVFL